MRKQVLVYIEGEGGGGTPSTRKHRDGEFRKCWKQFLQPLADEAQGLGISHFQCIPGRGGSTTGSTFSNPLPLQAGALRILIVDSEVPIEDVTDPWWALDIAKPDWADDDHCYLMVQCLETWLVADPESLANHYNKTKKCFDAKPFKAWPNLEETPKKTVQAALEKATKDCGGYNHADGNMLIAIVNRDKLRTLSSVNRLFTNLQAKIREYAAA